MMIHQDVPSEVVIEVTSKCNFDCGGCFNKMSFAEVDRNESESNIFLKKIIDSVHDAKIEIIRFSGGEPLLRKDIFDLISYGKKKGLKVRLNTNASLINERNVKFIDKYVDNILVSFNGHDAQTDEHWTQLAGSFEKKIKGLTLLNSFTKVPVRLGTILTPSNIANLPKFYEAIRSFNISHWEVYRPITKDLNESIKNDIERTINNLISLSVRFGALIPIANAIPFCLHDKELMNLMCLGARADDGHSRVIIDPRGFAKPSYFINQNIGSPLDILSCWNHPFMKDMRQLKNLPDKCLGCEYLQNCKGGSRYKAHLAFGSYAASDPLMP